MCYGMGLTASAVGERITLVWSLTEPRGGCMDGRAEQGSSQAAEER